MYDIWINSKCSWSKPLDSFLKEFSRFSNQTTVKHYDSKEALWFSSFLNLLLRIMMKRWCGTHVALLLRAARSIKFHSQSFPHLSTKRGDLAGALSRKSLSSQKPSFLLLHSLARRWPPINGYVFCRCFIFVIFIRQEWDCSSGLMSAITPAATYLMSSTGEIQGEPIYGRYGNPSRNSVEAILARLEGAEHAMCFSSGNTGCKQKPGTTTL